MTPSGQSMMRLKEMLGVGGCYPDRRWRNERAQNLTRLIAWYRRPSHPDARARTKRVILEDIIPDIGWPRWTWLKPAVRAAQADIEASLADWESQ